MTYAETGASIHASKVDAWLVVVTAVAIGVSVGAAIALWREGGVPTIVLLPVTLLLGAGMPLWILLGTRYELSHGRLLIRCGPFRWTVPLKEIRDHGPPVTRA